MSSHDSSFGSRGQIFAQLSSDSRLHLWDVASKKAVKSYVDKNHLTHSFTCYSWSASSKENQGLLAVGFSDGVVVIWDLSRGVVAMTIGTAKESETPTDIVFSKDGKSVFVSTDRNEIAQYSVETGGVLQSLKTGKKGVQKMALNPKVDVLAAAR
jgi:WD40 repeat protein